MWFNHSSSKNPLTVPGECDTCIILSRVHGPAPFVATPFPILFSFLFRPIDFPLGCVSIFIIITITTLKPNTAQRTFFCTLYAIQPYHHWFKWLALSLSLAIYGLHKVVKRILWDRDCIAAILLQLKLSPLAVPTYTYFHSL